ncbi:hypothetical protein Cgig2_030282 [Carnegiea gigantea]|uniref:Uncharacterized protein n=1 Tax=Carnegiea gigantea TaxID=171969 RepID=A0A9Q1GUZ9_9CARY|nr:hypothetical protein Cgig2_030282 [Carnegiea gigantea]
MMNCESLGMSFGAYQVYFLLHPSSPVLFDRHGRLQGIVVGVAAAPSLPLAVEGHARRLIAEAVSHKNLVMAVLKYLDLKTRTDNLQIALATQLVSAFISEHAAKNSQAGKLVGCGGDESDLVSDTDEMNITTNHLYLRDQLLTCQSFSGHELAALNDQILSHFSKCFGADNA